MSRANDLEAMHDRLLTNRDHSLRRCWFCGEWSYALNDCAACTAPADRTQLLKETS